MALLLSIAVCTLLATPFPWFMTAGAKTFRRDKAGGAGSTFGEISFLSGTAVILGMGLLHGVPVTRAIVAAALGALAIVLYEWARRTVLGLGFSIGLSGQVPDLVCEAGPYRLMRHPFSRVM